MTPSDVDPRRRSLIVFSTTLASMFGVPDFDFGAAPNLAGMTGKIFSEANMVAYVDAFWLIFILALAMVPVVALMRPPRAAQS